MIATEGQPGCGFNTTADNNRANGRAAMYVRADLRAWVCICMHECVGRAEEHVYEAFQYSGAVSFLKGDSSRAEGRKIRGIWNLSKIARRKKPCNLCFM